MADALDESEAGRLLARTRWGNQVAVRAASVFLERIDEVPDEQLAEVEQAIAERKAHADAV